MLHHRYISASQIANHVVWPEPRFIRLLFAYKCILFLRMAPKKLYLVAFDLLSPGDYASLKTRMGTLGAQQILERVWAVLMSESAREVQAGLRGLIDGQDRILVVELGHDWASRHALFPLGELIEPRGGPAQMLWRQKRWHGEADR